MRTLRLFLPVALGLTIVWLAHVSMANARTPDEGLTPLSDQVTLLSAPPLTPTAYLTAPVPILMYHNVISPGGGGGITVGARDLAAQMEDLRQNGYTSVSIDQIAAALRGQGGLPPKPVAITFDDGWTQAYTNAMPILQSHGFRATFFVVAGYSHGHSPTYLNWDQIKALRNAGMWIGSHSFSHSVLNGLNAVALRREVADSKAEIEKNTGGPVTVFAYPYGALNSRVAQAVQDAGYVAAVAINPRIEQRSDLVYRLNRITMSGGMTLAQFDAYLAGKAPPVPFCPRPVPPVRQPDPKLMCRRVGC